MNRSRTIVLTASVVAFSLLSTGCAAVVGAAARSSFTSFVTEVFTAAVNASVG